MNQGAVHKPGPKTVVGSWLLARAARDQSTARKLLSRFNNGQRGWNEAEPAVMTAACEIALAALFPLGPDEESLRDLATRIRNGVEAVDSRGVVARVNLERLAIARLGGTARTDLNYSTADTLVAEMLLFGQICRDLELALPR